jgi:adenosylcobyric acid synthase
VHLRYVERPEQLGEPDLAIIPGTKTTIADLDWLRSSGLADRLVSLHQRGVPILGICGGYQMLGRVIRDPERAESDRGEVDGLGLLPVKTTFATSKRTVRVRGVLLASAGPLGGAEGSPIVAYEIHMGRTVRPLDCQPLVRITESSGQPVAELDGLVSNDGLVMGTYLHGLLENDAVRHPLIDALAARRRARASGDAVGAELPLRHHTASDREAQLDRLAAAVRSSLDLKPLLAACGLG